MALLTFRTPAVQHRVLLYRSTAALGAGAKFDTPAAETFGGTPASGDYVDLRGFRAVDVVVFADQASAALGLKVIGSQDGAADHETLHEIAVSASSGYSVRVDTPWPAGRVEYTNGGTAQGSFAFEVWGVPMDQF